FCFFFQAEDGIRDFHVTGVQTCALPISSRRGRAELDALMQLQIELDPTASIWNRNATEQYKARRVVRVECTLPNSFRHVTWLTRSEERRVGKERRSRGAAERCDDRATAT